MTPEFKAFAKFVLKVLVISFSVVLAIFGVVFFIPTLGWSWRLFTKWLDYWDFRGYLPEPESQEETEKQ